MTSSWTDAKCKQAVNCLTLITVWSESMSDWWIYSTSVSVPRNTDSHRNSNRYMLSFWYPFRYFAKLLHYTFCVLLNVRKRATRIISTTSNGTWNIWLCINCFSFMILRYAEWRLCLNIMGIPIIKIRRSHDRPIFIMEIPIPEKFLYWNRVKKRTRQLFGWWLGLKVFTPPTATEGRGAEHMNLLGLTIRVTS